MATRGRKVAGRVEKAMSDKTTMHGGSSLQRGGVVQRRSTNEAAEQERETAGGGCGGKAADQGEHGCAYPVPDLVPEPAGHQGQTVCGKSR